MSIVNYTPENNDTTMYFLSGVGHDLVDLIEKIKEHFGPETTNDQITIRAENIHTRCLTYDLYDGADWDEYIVVEKAPCGWMHSSNEHDTDKTFYITNPTDLEDLLEMIKQKFGDVELEDIVIDTQVLNGYNNDDNYDMSEAICITHRA